MSWLLLSITLHVKATGRVDHVFPLCFREFKLIDPFATENPYSENVCESNSLSNSSDSGSICHFFFKKFLQSHLHRFFLYHPILSSFVSPLQFRGFRAIKGDCLEFLDQNEPCSICVVSSISKKCSSYAKRHSQIHPDKPY
jgi:hypothetical protein